MTKIPYTFSGDTLSAFVKNKLYTLPKSQPNYERLIAYLVSTEDHNEDHAIELLDVKTMITRLTAGKVTVAGNEVFYKGTPIRTALTQKLMEMLEAGEDATPWANFLNNLMRNPSERSKECLFNFIENHATPLTPDGCFVAWKYVTADFKSAHASPDGTHLDHTPGVTVEMDRKLVDDNPDNTCSTGLHACASPYLGGYTRHDKVVKVKINPRDVVAIPKDYSFQKMRCCRYYVMEEVVDEREITRVDAQRVTEDASSKVDTLPDELVGLPVVTTMTEFNNTYARERNDVEAGDIVVKKGGIIVGYVADVAEDQEEPDGYFDEDGDWIEEDYGEFFWSFDIVWQTGFRETIVLHDGDFSELAKVTLIPDGHEGMEDALGYTEYYNTMVGPISDEGIDTSDIPEQGEEFFAKAARKKLASQPTFEHKGKVYTGRQLLNGIKKAGSQRAYCRETGLKRSTLQGWLAKVEPDQIELDDADGKVFKHAQSGTEIEADTLVTMVQEHGQRALSRMLNVPRSTLQGWLASI